MIGLWPLVFEELFKIKVPRSKVQKKINDFIT